MDENNQVTGNQEPQYTAPQVPNQQPVYPQQPQYAAPQAPNQQPVYPQQPQYTAPQAPNQQPVYPQQPQYNAPQQPNPQYVNQQPPYNPQPAPYYAAATDNSKAYCVLSYLWILWLIGLLGEQKHNPRVRFHVNQGIILTICEVALGIVSGIINAIIGGIFRVDYLGYWSSVSATGIALQGIISFLVWAVGITLTIIGIVNAAQNKDQPLPVIGKLFTIVK